MFEVDFVLGRVPKIVVVYREAVSWRVYKDVEAGEEGQSRFRGVVKK